MTNDLNELLGGGRISYLEDVGHGSLGAFGGSILSLPLPVAAPFFFLLTMR